MTAFFKFQVGVGVTLLSLLFLSHCSSPVDEVTIESEPVAALIGGTVLATQGTGLIATRSPSAKPFRIDAFLNPISIAHAAPSTCPAITSVANCWDDTYSGPGPNLEIFYDNCQSSLTDGSYWRAYFYLTFDSQASCDAVRTGGFGSIDLTGQKVVRHFGSIGDDQNNVRLAEIAGGISEAAYMYSKYPSGWQVDKSGGAEVTFTSSTDRRIDFKGMHAKGLRYSSMPVNTSSTFDLTSLADSATLTANPAWDHTVSTVKTGDTLFGIGPSVILSSNGSVSFGDNASSPTATFDGDLVVSGNTVKKGAVLRVQQNIAQGIQVAVVTEDLVYGDSTCCWPTSGTIESRFDLNFPAATTEDKLEFLSTDCGAIRYTTVNGESSRTHLSHCF